MKPPAVLPIAIDRCRAAANRAPRRRAFVASLACALVVGPWSPGAPDGAAVANAQSAGAARSTWVVREGEARFAVRAPEGFMRQNTEGAAIAAFTHPGRRSVAMVFELPDPLVQGAALSSEQRRQLREGDVFEADDRLCTFRVLGFETPGLIGRGELEGQRVVRFVATVPLRASTPAVFLLGPAQDEAALRRSFEGMLESARGDTHFQTRAQRAMDAVSVWGFMVSVLTAVAYAIALKFRWKKPAESPPTVTRIAMRAVIAAGVACTSLWWLRAGGWMSIGLGALLLVFAALQGLGAAGLYRARDPEEREGEVTNGEAKSAG
jgi:hypothetical protein